LDATRGMAPEAGDTASSPFLTIRGSSPIHLPGRSL
jgi:hypothetical protein